MYIVINIKIKCNQTDNLHKTLRLRHNLLISRKFWHLKEKKFRSMDLQVRRGNKTTMWNHAHHQRNRTISKNTDSKIWSYSKSSNLVVSSKLKVLRLEQIWFIRIILARIKLWIVLMTNSQTLISIFLERHIKLRNKKLELLFRTMELLLHKNRGTIFHNFKRLSLLKKLKIYLTNLNQLSKIVLWIILLKSLKIRKWSQESENCQLRVKEKLIQGQTSLQTMTSLTMTSLSLFKIFTSRTNTRLETWDKGRSNWITSISLITYRKMIKIIEHMHLLSFSKVKNKMEHLAKSLLILLMLSCKTLVERYRWKLETLQWRMPFNLRS